MTTYYSLFIDELNGGSALTDEDIDSALWLAEKHLKEKGITPEMCFSVFEKFIEYYSYDNDLDPDNMDANSTAWKEANDIAMDRLSAILQDEFFLSGNLSARKN